MTSTLISRPAKYASLAIMAALIPSLALASMSLGDKIGMTEAEITSTLEQQGYVVEEIEREDGNFEVEVSQAGQEFEMEIDATTGKIIELEAED